MKYLIFSSLVFIISSLLLWNADYCNWWSIKIQRGINTLLFISIKHTPFIPNHTIQSRVKFSLMEGSHDPRSPESLHNSLTFCIHNTQFRHSKQIMYLDSLQIKGQGDTRNLPLHCSLLQKKRSSYSDFEVSDWEVSFIIKSCVYLWWLGSTHGGII